MVSDGEMYKRNHLIVLEDRLTEVIGLIERNTTREAELVTEISACETVIAEVSGIVFGHTDECWQVHVFVAKHCSSISPGVVLPRGFVNVR